MTDHRKWKVSVDQSLSRNIKFITFCDMIKEKLPEQAKPYAGLIAKGIVVNIWSETLEQAPDGFLKGWSPKHIAMFSQWIGEEQDLMNALLNCGSTEYEQSGRGFIEKSDKGFIVHDFGPWQNHPVEKREKFREDNRRRAERQVEQRRIAYMNNPGNSPGIETPHDQVVSRMILLAGRNKIQNRGETLRNYLEGWIAQGHAQKLEGILMDQKNAGYNVIQLQRKYFDAPKKEERNFTQEAIDAAKKEAEKV